MQGGVGGAELLWVEQCRCVLGSAAEQTRAGLHLVQAVQLALLQLL